MKNILIVVDMQNDFIDGALGTREAIAIVPKVEEKIREFDGEVFFTRDTHEICYLETQEGKNLPVPHCIRDTEGWQIRRELDVLRKTEPVDKETFGSIFTVTVFFVPLLKVTSTFSVAVLPEKLLLAVSVRVLESAESFRERRPLRLTAFLM